ncbi:unnamed protein product [Mesocestoides corti]|uniref:Bestrophin homolog n=1 Tax=Mesocestoides corti TaxID=53468 RepID=A0A3P6H4C0_MESCO|nr:unnamed protein product [Mesocestoides corti]
MVLGFYVDVVVKRWWNQFLHIPWPDEIAMLLSTYVIDDSTRTKRKLNTVLRYINLSYILSMRRISSRVKKRYPLDQNLGADGIATPNELKRLQSSAPKNKQYWYAIPIFWASHLVSELRSLGIIISDHGVEAILKRLQVFRSSLARLNIYNMINFPLGFTQVATLTTYSYYISSIFGWQFLDVKQNYDHRKVDLYVPVIGILRLIFYSGWLKVAEALINPFGEDVDDFEIDEYIKRNLQLSSFIIEKLHDEAPPLCDGVILAEAPEIRVGTRNERLRHSVCIPVAHRLSAKGANLFFGTYTDIVKQI